jgi:AraC-like DNA-binding protein
MAYQEYYIIEPLRPYVKVVWSMESGPEEPKEFSMRILPDSCVEMVVHYNIPLATTFSDGLSKLQPKSFVISQMKSFIEIAPSGNYGFISIRFNAKGAYHFFGLPMKELAGLVVDLEDVWGHLAKEIQARIAETSTGEVRSAIIQSHLALQLSKNEMADKAVDFTLDEICHSKGRLSMNQLANKTGLSNRQLLRRFDQKVGMSPKEFSRIIRFIHATRLLKTPVSIYDIAFSCGYYDHAHFFHEFREFSGLNPGQFKERSDVFL